ncbi:uncharacterized protein N7459_007527 [Penicillium hispanicum]|uniref:uncharacterized protein n=1 Tax=Penicillium hispanicum TaxID=1080232 RepID=UPI00253FB388|nr:uncharacterized protein N7459_007527 [Penicillium hispanicum]KAJ5578563.1 hypothetical protein N7459_007527 [Penicillium hispanicum]
MPDSIPTHLAYSTLAPRVRAQAIGRSAPARSQDPEIPSREPFLIAPAPRKKVALLRTIPVRPVKANGCDRCRALPSPSLSTGTVPRIWGLRALRYRV